MVRMLQVALLCLVLGSAHSFTVSRNIYEKTDSGSVVEEKPKGNNTTEDDDFSISDLLEKANNNLGKNPTDPEVRELDIAVGYGLNNADPCTDRGCKWPKARDGIVYVPYRISNQFSRSEKSIIEDGLRSFAGGITCIRFIPQTTQRDYVDIQSDNGCYSYVGRQGGPQVVSLQRQGCLYKHIIQHEMLHALGFDHEQSRSDRDLHVKILLQNVEPGKEPNFRQIQTINLGTSYDYGSVMHYGRTAFSKNGQPTIVPIPDPSVPIGMAKKMSDTDILRINRLYSC